MCDVLRFCSALCLLATSGWCESWYFLAATKTNQALEVYPSSLYTLGANKLLRVIRVVSPSSYYVQECEGELISITYPNLTPLRSAVVHMSDPARTDDIVINPDSHIVFDGLNALSLGQNDSIEQLLGLSMGPPVGPDVVIAIEKVDLKQTSELSRVSQGRPQDYIHMYTMGMAGGPTNDFMLFGYREGKNLFYRTGPFGTKGVALDELPETFPIPEHKEDIGILAATPSYLVLGNYYIPTSKPKDDLTHLFIHDRTKGSWKELQIPGASSRIRLFGSWLAVIRQSLRSATGMPGPPWDPLHLYVNPGRENERAAGSKDFPNVQAEYSFGVARDSIIPGILELDNLQDGRRITIKTNEEDSEILSVTAAGVVLYRVNDTIFQANVEGGALVNTTAVAKDKDVPEIHWGFLGPTPPVDPAASRR